MESLERRNLLATFLVTTTIDENDVAPAVGAGLSLREAIGLANANADADTITFDPVAFAGSQTIDLSAVFGQLQISNTLTITGPGADRLKIDAQGNSRVMQFSGLSGNLSLSGLTIVGGKTTATETFGGGGIRFDSSGTLSLTRSSLSGNSAAGTRASGGGIFASSGALTLTGSTLSGNSTAGYGGGIFAGNVAVTLTSSTLSGNGAAGMAAASMQAVAL